MGVKLEFLEIIPISFLQVGHTEEVVFLVTKRRGIILTFACRTIIQCAHNSSYILLKDGTNVLTECLILSASEYIDVDLLRTRSYHYVSVKIFQFAATLVDRGSIKYSIAYVVELLIRLKNFSVTLEASFSESHLWSKLI